MTTAFLSRRKSKDSLGSESTMVENQTEESCSGGSVQDKRKYNIKIPKKMRIGFKKSQSSPTSEPPTVVLFDDVEQNNVAGADQSICSPEDNLFRRSKSSGDLKDSLNNNSIHTAMAEEQIAEASNAGSVQEKRKFLLKNPIKKIVKKTGFMKKQNSVTLDSPTEEPLDFNQNLEQKHLAEAGQQLLAQESCLFGCAQSSDQQTVPTKADEERLQKDYETLKLHMRMAIAESFNKENQETLKSAVTAIVHQEEQDRYWEKMAEEKRPQWRLMKCRQMHDTLLQQVVEERMQRTDEDSVADKLSTSLKREVCRMGKCIQKDLLWVVRNLVQGYPSEFDICNLYAQLYHKAFSKKLVELAQSSMDFPDCTYILIWIHSYYPRDVLKQKELESHINTESLEPLLPEEDLKTLLEQYFSQKEAEVKKWWCNALTKEKESWQTDKKLELIDGYYFSHLTVDIIPLVNGAMKEAVTVSGNSNNAQRILLQLDSFFDSYKKCIDKLLKGKQANIPDILKGTLVSIKQLREYIEKQDDLPDSVKTAWLATVSDLRDSCHRYFLTSIHKELKECYRRLWTSVWYLEHQNTIGDLLSTLENQKKYFSNLKSDCMEELFSQLHFEVMIEYVRRMLKQKLKLKNKDEQLGAAEFLRDDSDRINALFIQNGSKKKCLSNILIKLSEMVRLQDTETLKLEVVTFGKDYPDISEVQLDAFLQLKANLTNAERRSIKKTLAENRNLLSSEPAPCFFSKVPV